MLLKACVDAWSDRTELLWTHVSHHVGRNSVIVDRFRVCEHCNWRVQTCLVWWRLDIVTGCAPKVMQQQAIVSFEIWGRPWLGRPLDFCRAHFGFGVWVGFFYENFLTFSAFFFDRRSTLEIFAWKIPRLGRANTDQLDHNVTVTRCLTLNWECASASVQLVAKADQLDYDVRWIVPFWHYCIQSIRFNFRSKKRAVKSALLKGWGLQIESFLLRDALWTSLTRIQRFH